MKAQRWITCLLLFSLVLASGPSVARALVAPAPASLSSGEGTVDSSEGGSDAVPSDWWTAVQREIGQAEYHVTWQDETYLPDLPAAYQAPNRAHNLRTYFATDRRSAGIRVIPRTGEVPAWEWGLTWSGYGYAPSSEQLEPVLDAVGNAELVPGGNRIEYHRTTESGIELVEWYVNDERGLEQGFTLTAPPRPAQQSQLILELTLSGNLIPRLVEGGAIEFITPGGVRVLRYSDLYAYDATSRALPAQLHLVNRRPNPQYVIRIIVDAIHATYPIIVDPLTSSPTWAAESNQAGALLGASVSTAGDVNGDGYADVVVGAPYYDGGQQDGGRAYLYLGSAAGLNRMTAWTAEGDQADAWFGSSVSTAGDVNGDGYADLVVGAPGQGGGQQGQGRVYVYHGGSTGPIATAAWTMEGEQAGAGFGQSVGTAGDVNGDGYADLVVGAHLYRDTQEDEGRAYVYHGSVAGLNTRADWSAGSGQAGATFGQSVDTAGDVNGDGYADLVVGAAGYDGAQEDVGRAYVYHGSSFGLSTTPDWAMEGDQAGASLGLSVGTAGDVNGDGYADLVIGSPHYDTNRRDGGRVDVCYGSDSGLSTTPDWTVEGDQAGASLGLSVGTAGDIDGDGYADLVVGAPSYSVRGENTGQAYVYRGSASGLGALPVWTSGGEQSHAHHARSVGTAGDVNGDGYADLVVGTPGYDGGQQDEGRATVYYGTASGPSLNADWAVEGDWASLVLGFSLDTAGDVNGDGYSDLVVSAYNGGVYVYHGSLSGLSTTADWTAASDQIDAHFGYAVGTAGDVNGDGYADLVVGAPDYEDEQGRRGRVYVYHGSASGLSATADWVAAIDGTADSDWVTLRFGEAVGTAGDVNGDGYADLVVGATGYEGAQLVKGQAYVYHGSAAGLETTPAWIATSDQSFDHFGHSVGTAGDVNGDGYADLAVGAPYYKEDEQSRGRVYVYFGSKSGLDTDPAWTAKSDQLDSWFGYSAGTAGDVNGDGYADLVVGAPRHDGGREDVGRAYLYLGSASGPGPIADWTVQTDQLGAQLGYSVSTAGDMNGDGYADLVVGAPEFDGGQENEGRAYIYLGSASGLIAISDWTAESDRADARFGHVVSTAGDVNGDGYADFVAGAPSYRNGEWDEGGVFVYHGSVSGLRTDAGWTTEGDQMHAQLGYSVGTAGDVNGDGYADLVIGTPSYDGGQYDGGRVSAYYGSGFGLGTTANWIIEGDRTHAQLGYAVGAAGDVNGDGYADLVAGAPNYADRGRVYVYQGGATGLTGEGVWLDGSGQVYADFGRSVGTAGDVNGDGYADLVVGEPCYDDGEWYEGRAYVYHGSAFGLSTVAAWTAEGNARGARFGKSVGTAGDVNGDGYSDLVVGAPGYDDQGRAYVYHGSATGLGATAAWVTGTDQQYASFGQSVGAAGDVNGDGYTDLVVGAPYYDVPSPDGMRRNGGRVYVYHGNSTGLSPIAAWTAESDQEWTEFGYSVGSAGDVNGDGYADLAVGAPHCDTGGVRDKGHARVYYGSAVGLSGAPDWMVEGVQDCTRFGRSIGTAGDVNGDGYADLVIGAPGFDVTEWNDEGRAYLFYGSGGPNLSLNPRQRRSNDRAPIAPLGRSPINAFRLAALGRTPFGRGKVKLEWEVKPLGTPFDGTDLGQSAAWIDTGVTGVEISELVQNLRAETPYHWRVRLRYHPATTPFQQTSRWLTMPWNGWAEQDLRTGALLSPGAYLPVVYNSSAFD